MLSFLRRNAIALLALFIALGGTSLAAVVVTSNSQVAADTISGHKPPAGDHSNIITGSITSTDLTSGLITAGKLSKDAVTTGKIRDGEVTGADVDESTLSRVPDSSRLGGVDAAEFRPGTAMATQETDKCAVTGIYKLCAPVTLTVPSNDFYKVDVHTSMTAFGATAGQGLFCAAAEGPACLNNTPSGFSLVPGQYMNASHSGTAYFGPGTHTFGMAARFDVAPAANINTAFTTTTIRWHRFGAESAAAASATRAAQAPHVMTLKPLR